MSPLAKIASLSALASEKAAGPAAVHVGRWGSNFISPSSNFRSNHNSDDVVGLLRHDGAVLQQRGLQV